MLIAVNDRGYRIGESHQRAKVSDATVDLIREMYEDHRITQVLIAETLKLPLHYISKICTYQCRAQVPHNWKRIHVN